MTEEHADDIYYAVNTVMKKYPLLVNTCIGIRNENHDDIRQEIVSYLVKTSIPRWESDRKVNIKTYLYTCAKNHLINLTTKYSSRARREQGMWEYFKTAHDWNSFQEIANIYYREEGYRDVHFLCLVLLDMNMSNVERTILKMSFERKKLREIGDELGIPLGSIGKLRQSLFRKIRIQYNVRTTP